MQLYYVSSQKGGTGKTTFSWLIACALKRLHPEARVAFIDGTHAQGSRSLSLANPKETAGEGFGRALALLQGGVIPGIPFQSQTQEIAAAADRAYGVLKNSVTPVLIDDLLEVLFVPAAHVVLAAVVKRWQEESRGALLSKLLERCEFDYCVIDTIADPSGVLQESILRVADACMFLEDLRDYESLAGLGTFATDARAAGANVVGAVGNFLNPKIKLDGGEKKKTKVKSALALDLFTEVCYNSSIEVLDICRGNMYSLANTTNVYSIGGRLASSVYVEMAQDPSNRKNLEPIAQRGEMLAAKLEASCAR